MNANKGERHHQVSKMANNGLPNLPDSTPGWSRRGLDEMSVFSDDSHWDEPARPLAQRQHQDYRPRHQPTRNSLAAGPSIGNQRAVGILGNHPPAHQSPFHSSARHANGQIQAGFNRILFKVKVDEFKDVSLTDSKVLQTLFVDREQQVTKNVEIPKLVVSLKPDDDDLENLKGEDLGEEKESNNIITDYRFEFSYVKQEMLLKKIDELPQEELENCPFVANTGLFADLMATPVGKKSWHILVYKDRRGFIFMRTFKNPNYDETGTGQHRFLNFHRLLKLTEDERDKPMYEQEKYFKITSIKVNDHKIISMNEVSGIDKDSGDEVKIALKPPGSKLQGFGSVKFLDMWAQSQLSQQKKLVLGMRSGDAILTGVEVIDMTTDSMMEFLKESYKSETLRSFWDPKECLDFLYRFLTLVKSVLNHSKSEKGYVSTFSYEPKQRIIFPRFQKFDYRNIPESFV